ncbi:transcription termination/antitermination protein NusG [Rubritalea spongiae]|uniref:Transcription termination/antitermination protein NusG n=1 Tax=Rubritalea spongiae TaxID=430797 RepID=A0ABW5E0Q9_9BACT
MSEDAMAWYVVRSQPKRERLAASSLREALGIEVVCPIVKYQKVTRRGKVWWSEAMFPGYLFARFDRSQDGRAVQYAQGVLTLVQFGDYVPALSDSFMRSLKDELGDTEEVEIAHSVEAGESYEIAGGPLMGEMGEVVEVLPARERVRLLVEFIGGEREVELDIYSLLLPGRPDDAS